MHLLYIIFFRLSVKTENESEKKKKKKKLFILLLFKKFQIILYERFLL